MTTACRRGTGCRKWRKGVRRSRRGDTVPETSLVITKSREGSQMRIKAFVATAVLASVFGLIAAQAHATLPACVKSNPEDAGTADAGTPDAGLSCYVFYFEPADPKCVCKPYQNHIAECGQIFNYWNIIDCATGQLADTTWCGSSPCSCGPNVDDPCDCTNANQACTESGPWGDVQCSQYQTPQELHAGMWGLGGHI